MMVCTQIRKTHLFKYISNEAHHICYIPMRKMKIQTSSLAKESLIIFQDPEERHPVPTKDKAHKIVNLISPFLIDFLVYPWLY